MYRKTLGKPACIIFLWEEKIYGPWKSTGQIASSYETTTYLGFSRDIPNF
jgi:hypothetical protein